MLCYHKGHFQFMDLISHFIYTYTLQKLADYFALAMPFSKVVFFALALHAEGIWSAKKSLKWTSYSKPKCTITLTAIKSRSY